MAVDVTCAGCGRTFEAKRRSARWCTPRCRNRGANWNGHTEPATEDQPKGDETESPLVRATRADLEKARAVDTFAGQLALQLAKRLSTPEESGISSLSKELRTVMAAATAHQPVPTAEEPEDEVARARRRAAEKAGKAAS